MSVTYIRRVAELLRDIDSLTSESVREKMEHDYRVMMILRRYEKWRRGGDNVPPTPKEISWAIEEVIRDYKKKFSGD